MKKILAIMGSPRKKKNTDTLLESLLAGIDQEQYQIEKVNLVDLNISHCTGCDYCGSKGHCIIKDDMVQLYEKIDQSQIIILAAPVYFNSLNGLSKNMIDRCQKYWSIKYSLGQNYKRGEDRQGIFLATGGAPYGHKQFEGCHPVVDFFFKAINVDHRGSYYLSNTDEKPSKERKDIPKELEEIGRNIVNLSYFQIQK